MNQRTFRIHGPRGIVERAARAVGIRTPNPANPDDIPVTEIMTCDVVCTYADLALDALVDIMIEERLGCVPVVTEAGEPIGMVTKLDILQLLSEPPTTLKPKVADVMMPLAITLDDRATIAHAAALMASEDMHHVMIVSDRRLVGVISTMDVTRWLARSGQPSRP